MSNNGFAFSTCVNLLRISTIKPVFSLLTTMRGYHIKTPLRVRIGTFRHIIRLNSADMKYAIALLLGAVCIQATLGFGFGKPWKRDSLKVKYSPLLFNGFYDLPLSSDSKLLKNEYVKVDNDVAQLSVSGELHCPKNKDPVSCVIIANDGRVVGARTSFFLEDVKDVDGYDFEAVNTYKKVNVFNKTAYALDVYFFNPKTITEQGVGEKNEVAEGVWAYVKGALVSLPAEDPRVENYNGFQKQACFPQMGQHYFYGMNKTETDCSQHVPFFGIYHNGGMVGYGIANYGKSENNGYETVPHLGAKLIMPNRPKCVDDNINKNGLYSLHTYFVSAPALITCLFQ